MSTGKIVQAPVIAFQSTADCASKIKDSTDSLDKFSKVTTNTFRVAMACGATSKALANVTEQFETYSGLIGGLNIVNRVADWSCKGKNGDYAWKFWKKETEGRYCDDGYKSGTRVTAEAVLTGVNAIDLVRFLHGVNAFDLGPAAPILGLVKNSVLIPFSALCIWDAATKINQANKYVANTAAKVNTWVSKIGLKKVELIAKYSEKQTKTLDRIRDLKKKISEASDKDKKAFETKLGLCEAHFELKNRRWSSYIEEAKKLANDDDVLSKDSQFGLDCTAKAQGWKDNFKIAKSNATKEKTKSWLEIAGCICKIVLGILGIVSLFTGFAANPIFIVAFALGWVATHTLGLAKNIYGMYNPMKDVRKPTLQPLDPRLQEARAEVARLQAAAGVI